MKLRTFLRLLMTILCFLCLFDLTFVVSGLCLEDQQSMLLKLKTNLKFRSENSHKLFSWHGNIPCCEWSGVNCNKDGHVIGLDLSGESIYGGFDNSSSLFSFQNMQVLNMANNNFSSEIPSGFSMLKNLTYLNLSYAGFVGDIPADISQLTRLVTLDISSSSYSTGQPLKLENLALQKFVQNFTRIRQLYMDGVSISAPGHEWSNALLPLHGLEELSMSNCNLLGPLDSSLARLENLSVIRLDQNNLSSSVPETFANFQNLTILNLSSCGLTGTFPHKIFQVAMLADIDISFNKDLCGSLPEFPLNGPLRKLIASHTRFSGALPASISNLRQLSILNLSNKKFEGQLHEFSNISFSMLEILDLSSNNLEGNIPLSIFHLTSLTALKLSSNKLHGTLKLDAIQSLANLTTLDLSYNYLSIDTNVTETNLSSFPMMSTVKLAFCNLTEFPSLLRNQSQISTLDLSCNRIQGSVPTWIWQLDSLVQLNLSFNLLSNIEGPVHNISSTLKVLDLHSNQLQGRLPMFPPHATYLDYSSNYFSSIIPSDVCTNLSFIVFLSLSKNNLSGTIPQTLCNKQYLVVLDVSDNHFSGTIPECLTQSNTLVVLNLKHNKFHGKIPDTFPAFCAIRTLDVNGNSLKGPVPNSLANCVSLESLDLGNNHINDGFPCFLKKLSILRVMILRENKFHGPIECSRTNGTWHKLQIIDLALNNFSGFLPGASFKTFDAMIFDEGQDVSRSNHIGHTFGNIYYQDSVTLTCKGIQMEFLKILAVYTSIDFSSNNFEGPIPKELVHITGLHVLNLSHNALTGQIPSSIGSLKQLESLDLSRNYLDGEIPKQLASLSFLSYLDLSFNHLVGRIPKGTQLQSFDKRFFKGNEGLYGPPLSETPVDRVPGLSLSPHARVHSIDWNVVSVELGLVFPWTCHWTPCVLEEMEAMVLEACGLNSVSYLPPTQS